MEKVNGNASLDFKCRKKRGDGEYKEVQLYESFIYDGVKYTLYDCVYMYNGDSREPYVGKLTKIFELSDKTKKVEVHWFFRSEEISQYLGETRSLENEIFLATGEGLGLTNINPLDAIICPCNVVCLSKDNRNPQPSDEQRKAADFVFYRTFDIQNYAISDKMDDEVGGLEIKYVFNREQGEKSATFLESTSCTKEENPNIKKLDDRSSKEIKSDDKCVEAGAARGFEKKTDMPSMKSKVNKADKGEMKGHIFPVEQMENKQNIKRKNKTPTGSDKLDDRPFKKFKSDSKPPEEKRVELEVASDSERFKETSAKKLTVGSKSKHEDKSPDNILKASRTCGTAEDQKNSMISAKVTPDGLEGKNSKKRRDDRSFKVPDNKMGINSKSGNSLDIHGNKNSYNNKEAKEEQSVECIKKVSALSTDEGNVSPKPNDETSCWFKQVPWEDRLKIAYDQGRAILLHNVDPDYSSEEVKCIILRAFKEKCDAKILQQTSVSSPHYAQALILLKTKEAAHKVLTKLDKDCLMLSHGSQICMPLVGTPCPPISTKKNSIFFGHLTIDKLKFKNQREDEAVSSSHYPQANTIEFDLAMEWCLLQLRSAKWWEKFHEQQGLELENLKNNLKKNVHKAS